METLLAVLALFVVAVLLCYSWAKDEADEERQQIYDALPVFSTCHEEREVLLLLKNLYSSGRYTTTYHMCIRLHYLAMDYPEHSQTCMDLIAKIRKVIGSNSGIATWLFFNGYGFVSKYDGAELRIMWIDKLIKHSFME